MYSLIYKMIKRASDPGYDAFVASGITRRSQNEDFLRNMLKATNGRVLTNRTVPVSWRGRKRLLDALNYRDVVDRQPLKLFIKPILYTNTDAAKKLYGYSSPDARSNTMLAFGPKLHNILAADHAASAIQSAAQWQLIWDGFNKAR